MRKPAGILLGCMALFRAAGVWAYPLDGDFNTGIARLEGYRFAQANTVAAHRLAPGALLKLSQVDLRLTRYRSLTLPAADPEFTRQVKQLLGKEADRYGIAVLDLSAPEHPRLAQYRGSVSHNPGSTGKLLVALGIFQALADIHPNDIPARCRILRERYLTADPFILTDAHEVPFWNSKTGRLRLRPLKIGDSANLWTYMDWMLSASSNAAASMVMRELILMAHFGKRYPVDDETAAVFFQEQPKEVLAGILARALQGPVTRNGLDSHLLRQGKFFTLGGKRRVPGTTSRASALSFLRVLLLMEQGRLVDDFSSREMKRLLYMTQRRIRYASSPALTDAALYFKSGSLYGCRPEPGFTCEKYKGNVVNLLNSVVVVESPARQRRLLYMVVVMSNVLRKNSAVVHQTLATRLHRLIESFHRGGQRSRQ